MSKIPIQWVPCTGEAHSNPFIDNCGVCMPFWGEVPVAARTEDIGKTVWMTSDSNSKFAYESKAEAKKDDPTLAVGKLKLSGRSRSE